MAAEQARVNQSDVLHRLLELSVAAADAETAADIARVLTEIAAPLVGAANAAVATWEVGDDVIRVYQGPTATKGNETIRVVALGDPTPLTDAIRDRAEVHVWSSETFVERFPKIARRTQAGEVTAMATYPLVLGDEVLGSCFFRFSNDQPVGTDQVELMQLMVPLLVRALARIRDRNEIVSYSHRLEQSNRDLDNFAAVVAHDLSAPVRRIGSFLQLLEREIGQLDGKAEKYAATIRSQVQHLDALLRDTLAYAQVVSPNAQYSAVELTAIATSVVAGMADDLDAVHAEVVIDDLPRVEAEESLIRQVLQNLLDNSVKYRALDRPIHIRIAAEPDSARGDEHRQWWRISIHDNGIGIDPTQTADVFSMFTRLEVSDDRPGTGVGLAFVKRVIERHGGSVGIEPGANKGTTVWFTMPGVSTADQI